MNSQIDTSQISDTRFSIFQDASIANSNALMDQCKLYIHSNQIQDHQLQNDSLDVQKLKYPVELIENHRYSVYGKHHHNLHHRRLSSGASEECDKHKENYTECIAHKAKEEANKVSHYVIFFLFFQLLIGQVFKMFAIWSGIPYTSMITVVGFIMGANWEDMGYLGKGMHMWGEIGAHDLLLLFLPALIFESAFNTDFHIIKKQFFQILILAGPIVLLASFLAGAGMKWILQYRDDGDDPKKFITFEACLMAGAILSATDPVAVVALLKDLGASKKLATLIEGESLLNDGTAMVVFLILLKIVEGEEVTGGQMIGTFCRLSFGGPALGLGFGIAAWSILKNIQNNFVLEVNITIFTAYILFFVCENTAVHVSGILGIVVYGLFMSWGGKTNISPESAHALHHVWGYVGFIAETVIFILSGIILGVRLNDPNSMLEWEDLGKVVANYVLLHIIRFLMILLFWPLLKRLGYGMSFNQVLLSSYAGLRGAVGLALALMVVASDKVGEYTKEVVLLHVGMVAVMTLLINATTTGWVVKKLGLAKQTDLQKSLLAGVIHQFEKEVDQKIEKLKVQRYCNQIEWPLIKDKIELKGIKKDLEAYQSLAIDQNDVGEDHMTNLEGLNQKISAMQGLKNNNSMVFSAKQNMTQSQKDLVATVTYQELMQELRHKYLTIVKTNYWNMFESGAITPEAAVCLIGSADFALDDEGHAMDDWTHIYDYLLQPQHIKFFLNAGQMACIGNFMKDWMYNELSWSYDIGVGFIEAHQDALKMLQGVIENKDFMNVITEEAQKNVEGCEKYVNREIEDNYPEVCKNMQHRRAEIFLLKHEAVFINKLLHNGQIENKDASNINSCIDAQILELNQKGFDIKPLAHKDRIQQLSDLAEIFTQDELTKCFENQSFEEMNYLEKQIIVKKGEKTKNIIHYVTAGETVEKFTDGDEDLHSNSLLRQSRGAFNSLQNLLPASKYEDQITNVYTNFNSIGRVIPIDIGKLKSIIASDKDKLQKLWSLLAYRSIILYIEQMPNFKILTTSSMKLLCRMSSVCVYSDGGQIDLEYGGVVLQGSIRIDKNNLRQDDKRQEDYEAVNCIVGDKSHSSFFACDDDTVVMHFNESVAHQFHVSGKKVTNEGVEQAHEEYMKSANQAMKLKSMQNNMAAALKKLVNAKKVEMQGGNILSASNAQNMNNQVTPSPLAQDHTTVDIERAQNPSALEMPSLTKDKQGNQSATGLLLDQILDDKN